MTDAEKISKTFEKEFARAFKELGVQNVDYYEDGFGFTYSGKYVRFITVLHNPSKSLSVNIREISKKK